MSSRVGQVFAGKAWFALVTEGPHTTRHPGSATPSELEVVQDLPVYTVWVWGGRSPLIRVERWEGTIAGWEADGKRLA